VFVVLGTLLPALKFNCVRLYILKFVYVHYCLTKQQGYLTWKKSADDAVFVVLGTLLPAGKFNL